MNTIKVKRPGRQSRWLQNRHRDWHANRPWGWNVSVEGCQECLLEIIWKQNPEFVLGICRFHYRFHPNILPNEYHLATHQVGKDKVVFGWFKACSHCLDLVFVAWALLAKLRFG